MPRGVIVFLALVILLSGCGIGGKVITLEVDAGKEIVLDLDSDYTSGSRWQLAGPLDADILEFKGSEYVEADNKERLTFKALGPGRTAVALKNVRGEERPAKTGRFVVIVR